ncbi:hypothetical protein DSO57_1024996 [Entomophthora muscae]|uniref:Uncharacterized protein n=1 Tax=Entomophthora muscae TaxID=34485 RepID=A0ACC2T3D3_9FUNG|nr:hypothetical protein DSO57_1024996 [Entomophthora muscae]
MRPLPRVVLSPSVPLGPSMVSSPAPTCTPWLLTGLILMGLNAYFHQLSPVSSLWSPLQATVPVLHWMASWWFVSPGWEPNLVSLAPLSHTNSYGYSVLAVPETIPVPYKLCSGKTTTTSRIPTSEAKSMVACPYLAQAHQSPVLVDSSEEAAELAEALFHNVTVSLPLQTVYREIPALQCMLVKWEKELEAAQDVLAVLPPFGKDTTRVKVSIQKVKIKAILDMSSPVNMVSSKLMKKLKLAPDLKYTQLYGTAGMAQTRAIGAYSALPMRFGKLLITSPAVVLENKSYDLLVGTQFLQEYNRILNLQDEYLLLLGYEVPLIFEEPPRIPGKCLKTCMLEYPTGIFSLKYRTHSSSMCTPPPSCPAEEGVPLLAPATIIIPPGSQVVIDSQISYELPEKSFLELYSPESLSCTKPCLCPGILDQTHKEPVQLLLANLTALPM